MRVLHITPRPLPDLRVERAILSDNYNGFEVHLAAPGVSRTDLPIKLDGFHRLRFTLLDKAGFRISRRILKDIVRKVRPDVIHAHDFPAAYLAKGLAPIVYDAHEDRISTAYHRAYTKLSVMLGRLARLLRFIALEYAKLNLEAARDVVVVAPSEGIVKRFLEAGAKKGFVLPNFPHRLEVPKLEIAIAKNVIHGAVDRPKYLLYAHKFPRRSPVEGFPKLFETGEFGKLVFVGGNIGRYEHVYRIDFVPHMRLYRIFRYFRTLLVPRKPYSGHRDISPNRVYTLSQVGAVPIIPYTLEQVKKYLPSSITFSSDEEFRQILKDISSESPEERLKRKEKIAREAEKARRLDDVQKEAYKAA